MVYLVLEKRGMSIVTMECLQWETLGGKLTTKVVCKKCNETWMSDIETGMRGPSRRPFAMALPSRSYFAVRVFLRPSRLRRRLWLIIYI